MTPDRPVAQDSDEPYLVDRFGEPIRPSRSRVSGSGVVIAAPEPMDPVAIERRRTRFRTAVTIVWLLIVAPLLVGLVLTGWVAVRNTGHSIAASRVRLRGALVHSRDQNSPAPTSDGTVVSFTSRRVVSPLTDADMDYLPLLSKVVELRLPQCEKITPAGLKTLGRLTDLEELHLGSYSSAGPAHVEQELEPLLRLKKLKTLGLEPFEGLSDRQLKVVGRMSSLRELYIGMGGAQTEEPPHPGVTDAGLAELAKLNRLESLSLARTGITDVGLVHLQALKLLDSLDLQGTGITDTGLEALKGIPSLRVIRLEGTAVTRKGVESLQQALPTAMIFSDVDGERHDDEIQPDSQPLPERLTPSPERRER